MQQVRYYVAFRVIKGSESIFGAVTCASGCFSAYRRTRPAAASSTGGRTSSFLGRPATYGDDRALTNYDPARLPGHVPVAGASRTRSRRRRCARSCMQQLRWKKSWLRESLHVVRFIWRKHPVAAALTYFGCLFPWVAPIVVFHAALLGAVGVGDPLVLPRGRLRDGAALLALLRRRAAQPAVVPRHHVRRDLHGVPGLADLLRAAHAPQHRVGHARVHARARRRSVTVVGPQAVLQRARPCDRTADGSFVRAGAGLSRPFWASLTLPLSAIPIFLYLANTPDGYLMYLRGRYALMAPATPQLDPASADVRAPRLREALGRRRAGAGLPEHRHGRQRGSEQPLHRRRARTSPSRCARSRTAGFHPITVEDAAPLHPHRRHGAAPAEARPDHVRRRAHRGDAAGRPDPARHRHAGRHVRDRQGGVVVEPLLHQLGRARELRVQRPLGAREPHLRPEPLDRRREGTAARLGARPRQAGRDARAVRPARRRRPRPRPGPDHLPQRRAGDRVRLPVRRLGPARARRRASSPSCSRVLGPRFQLAFDQDRQSGWRFALPGDDRLHIHRLQVQDWTGAQFIARLVAAAKLSQTAFASAGWTCTTTGASWSRPPSRSLRAHVGDAGHERLHLDEGDRPELRRRPVAVHAAGARRASPLPRPRHLLRARPEPDRPVARPGADARVGQRDRERHLVRCACGTIGANALESELRRTDAEIDVRRPVPPVPHPAAVPRERRRG